MLDELGVTYSYVVQQPGDIVYIAPRTLHCGINWGGNLAVAINLEGQGPQGVGCACLKIQKPEDRINGANRLFQARYFEEEVVEGTAGADEGDGEGEGDE